jgi:Tol biopolymer transport system component
VTAKPRPASAALLLAVASASFAGAARAQQPMARANVDASGAESLGYAIFPALSADGRWVAFETGADDLVPGDTNDSTDIFVHDRVTGAIVRVSVSSAGVEADNRSGNPSLSADGRFVVFESNADNLIAHDTNRVTDVFLHDRDPDRNGIYDEGNGETRRVSVDSNWKQAWGWSFDPQISADGTCVVFQSYADSLVAGDTNQQIDVFVRDLKAHTTERVNVDSAGKQSSMASWLPSISSDGGVVAFESDASDLVAGDTNGCQDVFVHDRASGTTVRVSVDSAGNQADGWSDMSRFSISDDGNRVAFYSGADNLVANDTNGRWDAFVHDVAAGTTVRASVDSTGAQSLDGTGVSDASISGDGTAVLFTSDGGDLVPRDSNGVTDCFRHDLVTGATDLISGDFATNSGDSRSIQVVANRDGSVVAFASFAADLVDGDTNGAWDAFVFDRNVVPLQGSWTNYGAGLAGTLGVPSIALSADPEFGASPTLDVGNSAGAWSVAFLVVGTARASLPVAGGTLLVLPGTIAAEGLPLAGLSLGFTVPYDATLFGFVLDVQVIEIDAGASQGLSFTPGLELVFGQ